MTATVELERKTQKLKSKTLQNFLSPRKNAAHAKCISYGALPAVNPPASSRAEPFKWIDFEYALWKIRQNLMLRLYQTQIGKEIEA